jgi:catechol 2,3-dioxygenase-like lactoylglutathione lyase family enzyme
MTTTPNAICITQVATVFVPVSDQDRALEFYVDRLGFEKRVDFSYGGMDIESDHATLRARGVDVDAEIARKGTPRAGLVSLAVIVKDPVPPQFFFRDIDGNRFLIVGPG